MKNHFKLISSKVKTNYLVGIMMLFVALCSFSTGAQNQTISGVVTDEVGLPLPGANVLETGTLNGVTTDFDGKYTLQTKKDGSITFSYVGYKTVVVNVANQTTINIKLNPDLQQLDDIIIVGYGTVKKKDLTGSVASVNMEKLLEAPVVNFDQALAGRVAGVQVSSISGEPGAAMEITIRGGNTVNGDNSPLYVLDGFIIDNFNPGLLNPTDIESIDILKDASATAIYGARGANGVVLITTKQAKAGKTQFTYETRLDVKNITKKMNVLNAYEFVKLSNEINPASTSPRFFIDANDVVVGGVEDYLNAPAVNWQDEAFRSAFSKTHTLKISSGNEITKFDASVNILNDEGTLLRSSFDRINGRLNLRHKINKKIDLTFTTIYTNSEQLGLNTEGTATYSFLRNVISYTPVVNKFLDYGDSNPLFGINPTEFDINNILNWHPIVSLDNEYRKREVNQLIANLSLRYKVAKNLVLDTRLSFNADSRRSGVFNNSNTVYGRLINPINGINGSMDYQNFKTVANINTLTYTKKIGQHNFNALVGTDINIRKITRTFVSAIQIPQYAEVQGINALDEGTLQSTNDLIGSTTSRIQSFIGRLNYSYKDKYLLTASVRRDGSSSFAPGYNIGYFPSLALAWKAEEETFIKKLDIISQLKFKAGYGKTGNDRIPVQARFDLFDSNLASYFLDGMELLGQRPTSSGANPFVEWETTSQYNAGVDLGLFKGKIGITAEIYQKTTDNLLINADTAPSLGITSVWRNSGSVRNRGLELAFNTVNVSTKDFKWTTDFNISFNRNEVLSLPDGKPIFGNPRYYQRYSSNQYIVEVGKPLGNMFGYISDGVYQPDDFVNYNPNDATHTLKADQPDYNGGSPIRQPGDEKYRDITGDGRITPDDKTIIGNGLPKHFGGLGNTFSYKGFQLSTFFQWNYGNDILNANRLVFEESTYPGQNQYATVANRWTQTNQNTDLFRARGRGFEDLSSRVMEDGSFIRLKTVNLAYNVSKDIVSRFNLSTASFYLAAQNLITWTNYSGFDPEVSVNRSAIMPGVDYSSYPISRTFSIGLNLTF